VGQMRPPPWGRPPRAASWSYRPLRHPSYAGQWPAMIGVGLSAGNVLSVATYVLVPHIW